MINPLLANMGAGNMDWFSAARDLPRISPKDFQGLINAQAFPTAIRQVAFLNSMEDQRQAMLRSALGLLDPTQAARRIDQFGRMSEANAMAGARRLTGALPGMNAALGQGIQIGALNDARRASNSFMANQLGAEGMLSNYSAALGLMQPGMASPFVSQAMGFAQNAMQNQQPRRPTLLETALGIGTSLATIPGFNWGGLGRIFR